MTKDLRHTKTVQPSCSSSAVTAFRQQAGLVGDALIEESRQQHRRNSHSICIQSARRKSASMTMPARQNHFFSVVLQLALFVACYFVLAHAQVEFSSNEDKRNNFEREFLSFGKRAAPPENAMERNFMSFGKRASDEFGRKLMPFGKRYVLLSDVLAVNDDPGSSPIIDTYKKKSLLKKRVPDVDFQRDFMAFGKK